MGKSDSCITKDKQSSESKDPITFFKLYVSFNPLPLRSFGRAITEGRLAGGNFDAKNQQFVEMCMLHIASGIWGKYSK